jgi:hypothetical protein
MQVLQAFVLGSLPISVPKPTELPFKACSAASPWMSRQHVIAKGECEVF